MKNDPGQTLFIIIRRSISKFKFHTMKKKLQ